MSASASRIAFIVTPYRRAVAENATVKTQYGSLARQSDDPIPTFFDAVSDAQALTDERIGLLSANRRRFSAVIQGVEDVIALTYAGSLPVVTYTDPERAITDRSMLVTEITIDFEKQNAVLGLWG